MRVWLRSHSPTRSDVSRYVPASASTNMPAREPSDDRVAVEVIESTDESGMYFNMLRRMP